MSIVSRFYKLSVDIIGDDWERDEKFFFKSIEEAEEFKNDYDSDNRNQDGEYIPTISSIYYDIEPVTFEAMLYEISAKELASMFGKRIVLYNDDTLTFE